QPHPDEFVGLM
uniref:Kassinin-like peptide K-I n=1 Tax=Pseudophryne guentheri TaxID=30349 RepID=TKN1_PSEGU|nr:RecName: Full=Kassinin-like peptide K-I; AltName: Full=PG-KI [Pseudophryne guentheri]